MLTLFREGGFPMYVILALGVAAIGAGLRAVTAPTEGRLQLVRHLGRAALYATLVGLAAALGAVFHHAPTFASEHQMDLREVILQGLGEAMSPAILGFTMLSIVAVFRAVAEKRYAPVSAAQ